MLRLPSSVLVTTLRLPSNTTMLHLHSTVLLTTLRLPSYVLVTTIFHLPSNAMLHLPSYVLVTMLHLPSYVLQLQCYIFLVPY